MRDAQLVRFQKAIRLSHLERLILKEVKRFTKVQIYSYDDNNSGNDNDKSNDNDYNDNYRNINNDNMNDNNDKNHINYCNSSCNITKIRLILCHRHLITLVNREGFKQKHR